MVLNVIVLFRDNVTIALLNNESMKATDSLFVY